MGEAGDAPDEAPKKRRGRPLGARDSKPRKRRIDTPAGQVEARTKASTPPAAKPPRQPRTAAPAVEQYATSPRRDGGQEPLPLNDLDRKLKADADWKEAQTRKLELDLAEREGRLISREDHLADLAARVLTLRKGLLALPARLRDDFAIESDPRRIDLRLRHELESLIREYAGQAEPAAQEAAVEASA